MSTDAHIAPRRLDEHERLRLHLEGVRERAAKAAPWGPDTVGVPAQSTHNPLLRINDVAFYANARNEIVTFADFCLDLLDLHRPRGNGGVGSGSTHSVQRCHSCMLRWPCSTVREMTRLLG